MSLPPDSSAHDAPDAAMAEAPAAEDSNTNALPLSTSRSTSAAATGLNGTPPPPSFGMPQLSASTEEILQRVAARNAGLNPSTPSYEAMKQHVLKNMRTSDSIQAAAAAATPPSFATPVRGGRGGRRGGAAAAAGNGVRPPAATPVSGRGRGAGRGRPRGRGRGGRRKSGKRKRGSDSEDDGDDSNDDDSESSQEYTPMATTTKSGRSVTKPTAYVPAVPSPSTTATTTKRRRTGGRPPSAASKCKTCQRGHSPQGNQIVFCDSCNAGYHQYCHHPPIENDVVLVLDKEWICGNCVRARDRESGGPLPEPRKGRSGEKYFSGERWTGDEKRRYFESLPPDVAVALLIRSTVLYPTIPIFPSIPGLYEPPSADGDLVNGEHPRGAAHEGEFDAHADDGSPQPVFFDDDPPAHYPKPGFGLARTLPPESEHLPFLVDENTEVFSHFFPAEQAAGVGGPVAPASGAVVGIGEVAVG